MSGPRTGDDPVIRLSRGYPTEPEVAAVVAVLVMCRVDPGGPQSPAAPSLWARSVRPGFADPIGRPAERDGWRTSGRLAGQA
jgi:acyl-CoA carboxylase epsilon subunit-like protein